MHEPAQARADASSDADELTEAIAEPGDFDGILDGYRFSVDVELAPAEVLAKLRARGDIECLTRSPGQQRVSSADDRFQAWALAERGFCVRARPAERPRLFSTETGEGPGAPVRSPTLVVEMIPLEDRTRVIGRIVQAGVPVEFVQEYSRLLGFAVVTALLCSVAIAYVVPSLLYINAFAGFGLSVGACLVGVILWKLALLQVTRLVERRWDERVRIHGPALRGLFGALLVPHALPEATPRPDPFRLRALRAPRRRAPSEDATGERGPNLEICMR